MTFSLCFATTLSVLKQSNWPTVNVFQWWGYLSSTDPYIQKIENQCHAKISYDQYYSNNEFLNRMHNPSYQYDIVIFSDTIYKAIKNKIANDDSNLYRLSSKYRPLIKKQYQQSKLAHNVVYFIESLTGFLYNPKKIKLTPKNNIFNMFKNAGRNTVVMLDDPVEAEFMLSIGKMEKKYPFAKLNKNPSLVPLTIKNFKSLYQRTHFIITNLPEKIITKPNFAFAFQWSGDAVEMMRENHGRLKFFIHPKLSYISADLLATLNQKTSTRCVAQRLGSRWFLNHEQNLTDYFSPYYSQHSIKSPFLKKIHARYIKNLSKLPWIISVNKDQFETLSNQWNWIKLETIRPTGLTLK